MHLINIFDELGPFTTLSQLYTLNYQQMDTELKSYFPLPSEQVFFDILEATKQETTVISELQEKENIIISGPELVLLEALSVYKKNVYVAIDAEINPDILQRIVRNVPPKMLVQFTQIPNIVNNLNTENSLMIVASFPGEDNHVWITQATYRIVCYYRQYYAGNIYFIHPQRQGFEQNNFSSKWVSINKELFATK